MRTNKILYYIYSTIIFVWLPLQLFLNLIFSIITVIPIVDILILLIFSVIWMIFFFCPIIGLSWAFKKAPILQIPIAIIGIPIAIIGSCFVSFVPTMGELESRWGKMLLMLLFPFSYDWIKEDATDDIENTIETSDFGKDINKYAVQRITSFQQKNRHKGRF